jgi:hypothetical protein
MEIGTDDGCNDRAEEVVTADRGTDYSREIQKGKRTKQ